MTTLREVVQARIKFIEKVNLLPNYLIIGEYEWHNIKSYFRKYDQEDISYDKEDCVLLGCRVVVKKSVQGFNFGYVLEDK